MMTIDLSQPARRRISRAPRYVVAGMNVIYDFDGEYWSGAVRNSSESGLFVETSHELPIGTPLTVLPEVSDDRGLPFEIEAEVVRCVGYVPGEYSDHAPGFGLKLRGLRTLERASFGNFLRLRGAPVRQA